MNYKDILAMASAYKEVAEGSYKTTKKEALDPVDAKALKGKHKDRKDKDIDNDGDVDSSDEYLHKRRKAVSKAMKGKGKETEVEVQTQESVEELDELSKKTLGNYVKKAAADMSSKDSLDMHKPAQKRYKGIVKATDKLAKESVDEAKSHGNTDNGSPRGEGLSPSAKKELDRTTPMNPATDEKAVNDLNFKTFKAMAKKAPMRSGDNAAGDKTMPSVKEEAENLDEISQDMQNRYLKKAAQQSKQSDKAAYTSLQKSTQDKHKARIGRRSKGIGSVYKRDQAKADPDFIHKPSATDRIKSGQGTMTNKPASALNKAYKDR